MTTMKFDVVIPLWNEAANLTELVAAIERSGLLGDGLRRAVLVNNGSLDDTPKILEQLAQTRPWIQAEHLSVNQGYGGGIRYGMSRTQAQYIAYIPGDNQVSCADLALVWRSLRSLQRRQPDSRLFVKGWRHIRHDPTSMRVVSRVYTILSNLLLHLRLRDVNALPKCFDRRLLDELPESTYKTFTLEPQLLVTARQAAFKIVEVPVVFHARREGVSSWSGKRWLVYWTTFWQMYLLRAVLGRRLMLDRQARLWSSGA